MRTLKQSLRNIMNEETADTIAGIVHGWLEQRLETKVRAEQLALTPEYYQAQIDLLHELLEELKK